MAKGTAIDHPIYPFPFAICHPRSGSLDRRVHDSPVEEVDVTLSLGDVLRVVRGQADRCAIGVELREHLHERFAALRIEIARWLVGQEDRGTAGNRAGDRDELLVTA